jgi:hypothetical protein
MEFTRKRNARGRTQKTYKEWYDETDQYRITWRSEYMGITVPEMFYACVRCLVRPTGLETFWNFCGKQGPYKTMKKAIESCERHRRIWETFFKIAAGPYKGRADRLRALDEKATFGNGFDGVRVMSMIPAWVRDVAEPGALRLLDQPRRPTHEEEECPPSNETTPAEDLSDLTEVSETTESPPSRETDEPSSSLPKTQMLGPVSVATDGDGATTKPRRRSSSSRKDDVGSLKSTAASATEPAPEAKKPAKSRTAKRSGTGKAKPVAMTTS